MLTHLNALQEMLKQKAKEDHLYVCIRDLVMNGLTLSRFPAGDSIPSRQDITQFIAAWFKFTGITAEECRQWMLTYCVDVLSPISSSPLSQVKHSTKSNLKYIFGSGATFNCQGEHNIFKAPCRESCPLYTQMLEKYQQDLKEKEEAALRGYEVPKREVNPLTSEPPRVSVRDLHKEQFENALTAALELIKKGSRVKDIVAQLNEKGFKSRTGMKLTYEILYRELKPFGVQPSREKLDNAMAFALDLVRQGLKKFEVIRRLNERGFKTTTGKEWQYMSLAHQLKKYIEHIGEEKPKT